MLLLLFVVFVIITGHDIVVLLGSIFVGFLLRVEGVFSLFASTHDTLRIGIGVTTRIWWL